MNWLTPPVLIFLTAVFVCIGALVRPKWTTGCAAFILVPAICFVLALYDLETTPPERLRSTSALIVIWLPIWGLLGVLPGLMVAVICRQMAKVLRKIDDHAGPEPDS